jgi:hypothetical protein
VDNMSFFSRFLNLARTGRVERDLDAEQQFHLDARVDELVAGGMSRERARAEAMRRFGGRLRARETSASRPVCGDATPSSPALQWCRSRSPSAHALRRSHSSMR